MGQVINLFPHQHSLLNENDEILWRLQEIIDESCNGGFNSLGVFGWEKKEVLKTIEKLLAKKDTEKIKLQYVDEYWVESEDEAKKWMQVLKAVNYANYWDKEI